MRKNPANPEQYETRRQRFASGVLFKVPMPFIHVSECRLLLSAYHGSKWKAGWAMIFLYIRERAVGYLWMFRLWTSDHVGWTKIYDIPETLDYIAHKQRHGRKCSGSPNCENINCVVDSVPKWFKVLTRWEHL